MCIAIVGRLLLVLTSSMRFFKEFWRQLVCNDKDDSDSFGFDSPEPEGWLVSLMDCGSEALFVEPEEEPGISDQQEVGACTFRE